MMHVFVNDGGILRWAKGAGAHGAPLPAETAWLDLVTPTHEEQAQGETAMGLALPTREQIAEIEESSRLRRASGAVHMTVLVLALAETEAPRLTPVRFVVAGGRLATIHYMDAQPFLTFRRRTVRQGYGGTSPDAILVALLEAVVERTAGVLRRTGAELDSLSSRAFRRFDPGTAETDDTRTLKALGQCGHVLAKARESLVSLRRMLDFLMRGEGDVALRKAARRWARGILQDVDGLDQYARFLSSKVGLLLDSTLGRITVGQNDIVKLVSVLTVILFPPLLVSSFFGMNFDVMPETDRVFGYPMAVALMLISAVLPVWYFKRRGWL
ncbi:magnesium transporter CorA family protein [Azospirillum sp. TSO22-1]|uniref:magnesium transporter CorA family protein n=1 Tax=Azospirillum sp. TSO22-1 TaxID=716789 RepID=UPI000D641C3D|nr:magnesium transporter CorA family protein [Azospirillum sp. TSO22-1]